MIRVQFPSVPRWVMMQFHFKFNRIIEPLV